MSPPRFTLHRLRAIVLKEFIRMKRDRSPSATSQPTLILVAARFIFGVPMVGGMPVLSAAVPLFIAANLAVGITFSMLANNQVQAVQTAFFFFLPLR